LAEEKANHYGASGKPCITEKNITMCQVKHYDVVGKAL
jgi:hypothetical protein